MDALGLDARVARAAAKRGFGVPTPVQAAAIPLALAGKARRGAPAHTHELASGGCLRLRRAGRRAQPHSARTPAHAAHAVCGDRHAPSSFARCGR
jgi:hypothetical protein